MHCCSTPVISCSPVSPIDCRTPTPVNGVIHEYNSTTVGSEVFYQCQQRGLTPSVPSSVCGEGERWSPDPSQVVCVMMTTVIAAPTTTPGSYIAHTWAVIGASLSEPHTSGTALWKCVNIHTSVLACGHIP